MAESSGMTIRSGPWPADEISGFLETTAIPIRVASSGTTPLVQSMWFLYDNGSLWCATQTDSVLAHRLRANDRCGFEVSGDTPPYRGVRGSGRATLLPDSAADVLPRLITRYLGTQPSPLATWLMSRLDHEVAIRIDQLVVTTWDYSNRM